jgi:hypothetical protein
MAKICSGEMLWNNLTLTKFHPAAVAPLNAITTEQVLRHQRFKRRGALGGQVQSPPLSCQCILFHILMKGSL